MHILSRADTPKEAELDLRAWRGKSYRRTTLCVPCPRAIAPSQGFPNSGSVLRALEGDTLPSGEPLFSKGFWGLGSERCFQPGLAPATHRVKTAKCVLFSDRQTNSRR